VARYPFERGKDMKAMLISGIKVTPRTLGLKNIVAMMYGENYEPSNYAYVQISTVPHDAPYVQEPLKELFAAMRKVGCYNNFDPAKVIAYLTKAVKLDDICHIRFGREYSVVLYLTVSMSKAHFAKKKERVLANIKKALNANEVWFTGADNTEIRVWWD
jgi:hypothetical protein